MSQGKIEISTLHVIAALRGGWSVRNAGAHKARKVFDDRAEAIKFARDKAREEGGQLFVHNSDGTVSDMTSYARRAG